MILHVTNDDGKQRENEKKKKFLSLCAAIRNSETKIQLAELALFFFFNEKHVQAQILMKRKKKLQTKQTGAEGRNENT